MEESISTGDIKRQPWFTSWTLLHQLKQQHRDLVAEYKTFCDTREFLKSHDELGTDVARELKQKIADLGAKLKPSSAAVQEQHRKHQLLCEEIGSKCHAWRREERAKNKAQHFGPATTTQPRTDSQSVPPVGC